MKRFSHLINVLVSSSTYMGFHNLLSFEPNSRLLSSPIDVNFFIFFFAVFRYKKGVHNVLDVDVSTFSKCAKPKDQRPLNTGNDFVPLTLPGFKWFISTIGHDCKSGQKLIISVENPPPPASVPQFAHPLSTLPSALVPALPIPMPPAPSPSAQSPAQNQTTPQLPIVPAPSQNIPPSHFPGPSATAPPPSGAAAKSPVSAYLGVLVVVAAVLAGIII